MSHDVTIQQVQDLLGQLVALPSVNPNRQPVSGPPFGEVAVVEMLAGMLTEWGAKVEVREVAPQRPNLIARFAGRDSSRCIMLEAHSDTVQIDGMTIEPFTPVVRDGRMYGRGTCDDKGPMTAMLLGIRHLLETDGGLPTDVCFVATCDEESGCGGARHLVAEGILDVDVAVVAEPTDLTIVHAHRGGIRWEFETQGVACHSSDPSKGVNAITAMAKIVAAIAGPITDALNSRSHPLLGHPTISPGVIHGGSQVNIVPAKCVLTVDRRLIPGETHESAIVEICRHIDAIKADDPTLEYTWVDCGHYLPLDEPTDGPLVAMVSRACESAMGSTTLATAPWGATAGIFHHSGIPSVLFGPGSIAQAHTKDEFIELAQVAQAAYVYADVIREFGLGMD